MPVEPAFHTGGWTAGWVDRRSNRLPQPPVYRRFRGPAVQPPVEPAVLPDVLPAVPGTAGSTAGRTGGFTAGSEVPPVGPPVYGGVLNHPGAR